MCKAGFAGDDAPRAVFRKSSPPLQSSLQQLCRTNCERLGLNDRANGTNVCLQPPLSVGLATMGKFDPGLLHMTIEQQI
jgi:hypothetical protein